MDIEVATTFLEALGGSHLKRNGDWLTSACPLAKEKNHAC